MQILLLYLLVINLVSLMLMFKDKRSARKRRRRRVRERTLLILACIGGGLGIWVGMYLFRHKTLHTSFKVIAPVGTIGWILLLLWLGYTGLLSR
ncbi:MAG: DUF1294 domain-containing protein [Firmicutes bacterium]|nr:DUF1294 domain-containing protein [Bacillota bacterium]